MIRRKKRKKKSTLAKSKGRPSSTYWRRRADALWGAIVHHLYPCCAVNDSECRGTVEAHHIISRSHCATRHEIDVGVGLCTLHHKYSKKLSPHQGPVGFAAWLQVNEPEKWEFVMAHRWKIEKPDYKSAYARLVATAQRLGLAQEEK